MQYIVKIVVSILEDIMPNAMHKLERFVADRYLYNISKIYIKKHPQMAIFSFDQ